METDTQKIKLQVPREELTYLDMVIKSHEGLAVLTVEDNKKGIVTLDVTAGTREEILQIIAYLQTEFPIKILEK